MNCRTARRRLVSMLDDELAQSESELVASHVEECPDCARTLARLEASSPTPPELAVSDAQLQSAHLRILSALADEPLPVPKADLRSSLTAALSGDVRLPRALVVLYAAALLGAVVWGAAGQTLTGPTSDRSAQTAAESTSASLELHKPAAYTPSDGWF
ncbi:MAG: anti-sigma factor [Myxococcota bacterium]